MYYILFYYRNRTCGIRRKKLYVQYYHMRQKIKNKNKYDPRTHTNNCFYLRT